MNHHNHLEQFAMRGLKAQAAVDEAIAKHNLPAALPSAGRAGADAGRRETAAPRSSRRNLSRQPEDILAVIRGCNDVHWLKSVLNDRDYQFAVRQAAQRRLGALVRKPKL